MSNEPICELAKNTAETIQFRLEEYRGHMIIDMRIYVMGAQGTGIGVKELVPTKKGFGHRPSSMAPIPGGSGSGGSRHDRAWLVGPGLDLEIRE